MVKYRVKQEYSFDLEGYMKGELAMVEYRPQTQECLMNNEDGNRIVVTIEYLIQCMELVEPEYLHCGLKYERMKRNDMPA